MTETRLRSITNSGTWMLILAHIGSHIFYEDLYRADRITTYVVPFVISMLLARDSIVGISIPNSISLPASLFTRSVIHHPATISLVTLLARLLMMCITERAQRYLSDNRRYTSITCISHIPLFTLPSFLSAKYLGSCTSSD